MEIREPSITPGDILRLEDDSFHRDNVCIVTGAGTGIGRATAIAAAANGLTVVGVDINEEEGKKHGRWPTRWVGVWCSSGRTSPGTGRSRIA